MTFRTTFQGQMVAISAGPRSAVGAQFLKGTGVKLFKTWLYQFYEQLSLEFSPFI